MEQQLERKHLRSETRDLLTRPLEDRMRAVEADIYIPYERADSILGMMERLMIREHSGRPLGMLISSASGNGKTTILRTFMNKHPPRTSAEIEFKPVIALQAPPAPSEKRFLGEVLKSFGVPDYDKSVAETRTKRVIHLVDQCQVKMLIIDEIHNLLSGSPRHLEETCNLIKYLANTLSLSIVLAGTERAENVIASDSQLMSRFPIAQLPKWSDSQSLRAFLTYLEATIPLPKASNLASDEKTSLLLRESGGVLGHIVRAVKNAAYESIMKEEQLISTELLRKNIASVSVGAAIS